MLLALFARMGVMAGKHRSDVAEGLSNTGGHTRAVDLCRCREVSDGEVVGRVERLSSLKSLALNS